MHDLLCEWPEFYARGRFIKNFMPDPKANKKKSLKYPYLMIESLGKPNNVGMLTNLVHPGIPRGVHCQNWDKIFFILQRCRYFIQYVFFSILKSEL